MTVVCLSVCLSVYVSDIHIAYVWLLLYILQISRQSDNTPLRYSQKRLSNGFRPPFWMCKISIFHHVTLFETPLRIYLHTKIIKIGWFVAGIWRFSKWRPSAILDLCYDVIRFYQGTSSTATSFETMGSGVLTFTGDQIQIFPMEIWRVISYSRAYVTKL